MDKTFMVVPAGNPLAGDLLTYNEGTVTVSAQTWPSAYAYVQLPNGEKWYAPLSAERMPGLDALHLALAVLQGDTDAALALADEVQLRHTAGKGYVPRAVLERQIDVLKRQLARVEARERSQQTVFDGMSDAYERMVRERAAERVARETEARFLAAIAAPPLSADDF